jgi:hypothetical protein
MKSQGGEVIEINSTYLLTQTVKTVLSQLPKGRDVADIIADLRFLRFDDDGVLSLIDAIIEGTSTDIDELRRRLVDFNDREWQVADTAARLLEPCRKISNLTHEELQLIGWRKPNVRRELQEIINQWDQPKSRLSKQRLKKVRAGIKDLNAAIDAAEDKLLHGRK